MVPMALDTAFANSLQIKQGNFLDVGVSGGYVHTFVLGERFFITASTTFRVGGSRIGNDLELPNGEREDRSGIGLGYGAQGRFALGYNSKRNYVGISFNQETSRSNQSRGERFEWSVGNLRINLVHRFNTAIRPLDSMFELISKKKS